MLQALRQRLIRQAEKTHGKDEKVVKIKIAIPSLGSMMPQCEDALLDAMSDRNIRLEGDDTIYHFWLEVEYGGLLHHSRNKMVDPRLHPKGEMWYDFVMFIDSDMAWEANWVAILASYNKPVVGGLCVRKTFPYKPTIFIRNPKTGRLAVPVLGPKLFEKELKEGRRLIKVDGIGTGFTMIRRDVIEKVEPPWFFYQMRQSPKGSTEWKDIFIGEDVYFCIKAQEAGFDIFCDFGMWAGHVGPYVYDIRDYITALADRADELHAKTGKRPEDSFEIIDMAELGEDDQKPIRPGHKGAVRTIH